ncbi:MAG: F0F1 ATP synthase subunit B [Clostridia bacterium]|nr:F0F1 ATP synthase subunit B [Clostridia bacterium]
MLDINFWEITLYIINIVILFFVLRWLLYKPITKFLEDRTDRVQKEINEAARKQTEAEQLKAKYDGMVSGAQGMAAEIVSKGKTLADDRARQIVNEAAAQAAELRERAEQQIEEEKKQALLELRQEVTQMAIQIASKILEREVTYADNKQIIDSFFEKVG